MTPLVFFLVLLLLSLFCSITHAQEQEQEVTYKLYPLVPFSIQIYSSSVLLPSVNDDSLKATIQSVTELYLKQFIDAEILHDEAPTNTNIVGTITGVSLQVSIKRPQASTNNNETSSIVALVSSGNAAFEQSSSTNATTTGKDENVVMDGFLKQSLQKAFTLPDVTTFQERLMLTPQEYLQQMTSMIVTLLDNVANDNNDTTTIPYTERTKTTRVTVTTLAVVFVITFCIVVFVRMRRHHHKMVNHHHAATSHHSYTSGGGSHHHHHHYDVRNLACRAHPPPPPEHHHHDMDPYEQCGTTTPRLMKARISSLVFWNKKNPIHHDDSHVATMTNDVYPIHNPRNTTTTTTTNHHHYYSSYRNNTNNEEEEEEDVVDHHIHRSGPFHGGSLASWVKSISSNVFHQSEKDEAECLFEEEEDSSGKRIVYRDFPRHDGTPCLIYNSPAVAREQSRKRMMVRSSTSATTNSSRHHNVNSTTVWATSNHEENNNDDEEEPVDSFVDRLEQLMVVRHEQYEERRHLEMIKRKSSRSSSSGGGNMSLQQAEAALDDFLDISMEDGEEEEVVVPPRVVSPTTKQQQYHVEEESNLQMASHLRAQQHAQVSWDEEDPTITEEERGVFS
jgi:hypothetical protein